ncbi:hypothetical protein Hanom_Chr04g00293101 [Helianthus anomalus]
MHRINQVVLMHCNEQENWPNDELLKRISSMIADVLSTCLTNLPRVIKMTSHHHA